MHSIEAVFTNCWCLKVLASQYKSPHHVCLLLLEHFTMQWWNVYFSSTSATDNRWIWQLGVGEYSLLIFGVFTMLPIIVSNDLKNHCSMHSLANRISDLELKVCIISSGRFESRLCSSHTYLQHTIGGFCIAFRFNHWVKYNTQYHSLCQSKQYIYTVYADHNQEAEATGKDICIDTLNDGDAITF